MTVTAGPSPGSGALPDRMTAAIAMQRWKSMAASKGMYLLRKVSLHSVMRLRHTARSRKGKRKEMEAAAPRETITPTREVSGKPVDSACRP